MLGAVLIFPLQGLDKHFMAMNRLKEMATSVSQTFAQINVFQRGGGKQPPATTETKDNMMALISDLKSSYRTEPVTEGTVFQIIEPRTADSNPNPEIFAHGLHNLDASMTILDLGQEEQGVIEYEDILEF